MSEQFGAAESTRREVLKKAAFVVPIVLTFPIVPSFASAGSSKSDDTLSPSFPTT